MNEAITIPAKELLAQIAQTGSMQFNNEIDPSEGFEFFNPETNSGFSSLITEDLDLFSIDFLNPQNESIATLSEVLKAYNLPSNYLSRDIETILSGTEELNTDYNNHWVTYKMDKNEKNLVLIRYRAFGKE
ncbi:hypothetical protein [Paenibacillus silagei]|uniref:Uncharacterized protein n=1 Tax=Paenibacillus silagei TaxID=1670801 RepID=A0ABS4NKJ3_9BACL|nr:hypothetical protein [Paenibacillus silagei]MBP2110582.1 hypothetical protein [Paenibacillus silagei]